jgi:hypothetical protein
MSNTKGLTFKTADSYEANEATTSVYFAATDGTTPVKFVAAEDGETASATYEVTVPAKTGSADVTYQTSETNAAGGHVYARYEGAFPQYSTKAFYIVASANSDAKAEDAWKTWAKGITATTRPSINIVYTVSNVLTEEEQAAADLAAEVTGFTTTYADVLELTTSTVTYEDLEDVNAALTAYNGLSAEAKAELADEKELLDALAEAAEALAGPSITMTETGLITLSRMTAEKNFKNLTIGSGSDLNNVSDGSYTQNIENWSETDGGTIIVQLGNDFMTYYGGKATTATLILSDDSTVSVTTTLTAP